LIIRNWNPYRRVLGSKRSNGSTHHNPNLPIKRRIPLFAIEAS
jgi:hypothetical protein